MAVAWAIERRLPRLWRDFADSLAHLRYHAVRADEVDDWIDQLLQRYYDTAEPYEVFEARRALWESVWAWTALTESIG